MPSEYEERSLNGGLGDIPLMGDFSVEKSDPHWQSRSHPSLFPPEIGSPGKPIMDPNECRPLEIPPKFSPEARGYFDFFQKIIEKTFRTSVEKAVGDVLERVLTKLSFATNQGWQAGKPPQDGIRIDRFFGVDFPIPVPASSARVVIGTINSITSNTRAYAVIHGIGTALENAAAFAFIQWSVEINGLPVRDLTNVVGQWGTITQAGSPATFSVPIIIPPGGTLTLLAANTDAVNQHNASARLVGWLVQAPFLSGTLTDALQNTATQSQQRFVSPGRVMYQGGLNGESAGEV